MDQKHTYLRTCFEDNDLVNQYVTPPNDKSDVVFERKVNEKEEEEKDDDDDKVSFCDGQFSVGKSTIVAN